jgi:predicted RNA binding protein YcfA (HicA-like mRNA interferase family)
MGKREKLIEQLTNSSHNATFAGIRKLLEYEGFYLDSRNERLRQRITGSHHIFKYAETTFVIPVHNNKVKVIYVRKVLELIELADSDEEEEGE